MNEDDVPSHFGIQGMKWGVRNEPGKGGRQKKKVSFLDEVIVGEKMAKKIASREVSRLSAYGKAISITALKTAGPVALGEVAKNVSIENTVKKLM